MTKQEALDWIGGGWRQSPYAKNIGGTFGIDTDGYYGFQCKDLANAYGLFLGHPFTAGNANALWDWEQDAFYQRISPDQRPQPGDVFIRTFISGGVEYDHTGVILGVDDTGFTSLDQNWFNSSLTKGSPPAFVRHGFDQIRGYLRPQLEGENMPTLADANIIKAHYRELLGREATDAEVASRLGQPVDQLFWDVATSPERQGLIRTIVQRLYQGFLQRTGSDLEIRSWASVPLLTQLSGIGDSAEAKAVSDAFKTVPALRQQAADLQGETVDLAKKLEAANKAPISDSQAADVVATKANPLLQFLALVWSKIIKKG